MAAVCCRTDAASCSVSGDVCACLAGIKADLPPRSVNALRDDGGMMDGRMMFAPQTKDLAFYFHVFTQIMSFFLSLYLLMTAGLGCEIPEPPHQRGNIVDMCLTPCGAEASRANLIKLRSD